MTAQATSMMVVRPSPLPLVPSMNSPKSPSSTLSPILATRNVLRPSRSQQDLSMGRPSMRRKSSAQNLLSSFKSTSSSSPPPSNIIQHPTPLMTSVPPSSFSMQQNTNASSSSTASTPTSAAPNRDFELHETSSISGGPDYQLLGHHMQRRVTALNYLKNLHEGRSYWFQTVMLTRSDLERHFHNGNMKKRTYRFAILGMSLSSSLDSQQPVDFLRGLQSTLAEYDQLQDEDFKPKMRNIFRSSKMSKRQPGANDFTYASADSSDISSLVIPSMPFPLDYQQTLLSLLEIITELYKRLIQIIARSGVPIPPQVPGYFTPLGASPGSSFPYPNGTLSPNPGSQGSTMGTYDVQDDGASSQFEFIWGTSKFQSLDTGFGTKEPPPITQFMVESIGKIDIKFKKIVISPLLKELDVVARECIKEELASLDPLLKNMGIGDAGTGDYFDPSHFR